MSSEIEIVEEDAVAQSNDRESTVVHGGNSNNGIAVVREDNLKNDVYTTAAYGDLEKLQRLVESERCYVSVLDNIGYYALQWATLNNRTAAAQYIIKPAPNSGAGRASPVEVEPFSFEEVRRTGSEAEGILGALIKTKLLDGKGLRVPMNKISRMITTNMPKSQIDGSAEVIWSAEQQFLHYDNSGWTGGNSTWDPFLLYPHSSDIEEESCARNGKASRKTRLQNT
ncbi:hypothetical protein DKX38_026169 [Salix brachista]|uniref:Uncharacterized protein n=1 Tax=Salix brachista TaxID=2182728 RepID=A0A5N5JW48_9ROSI|nr:hypothetical protein DKX38_026169 [Salix brachista]